MLVGVGQGDETIQCPHCQSRVAEKLVSRFTRGRDEDARMDELADRIEGMHEPDSASSMRDMVREVGRAMDEDLSDELEEMYESDCEEGS